MENKNNIWHIFQEELPEEEVVEEEPVLGEEEPPETLGVVVAEKIQPGDVIG